ncbi:alpha/beta hydrolase [Arcanobacterium hippocoleae]
MGTLLVNPGGPGGSGLEMIDAAKYYFPKPILENFDIIGFDPRGVGESTPINCLDDAELARMLEASYPDTAEGDAKSQENTKKIADGCNAESGELLPYVGTENAARDMDVIRHLAGDPKLYYLGYSYGTSLGGMYAELFPKNTGRMVLDGAVSSKASNFEQSLAQMKGFEKSLDAYLKNCINKNKKCPFKGSLDEARKQISYILKQTLAQPVAQPDTNRELTQAGLIYGIVTALYDDETWPILTQAFTLLSNKQDPSIFLALFDSYIGRSKDKFINNTMEANWAINCADYRVDGDEAQWKTQSDQMAKESPIFGATMKYSDALCAAWAYQPERKIGPFIAAGSAPIVVVGTTGDPATPYEWAKDFAQTLDNGHLVTWEGEGHTAYGHSTDCVNDAINAYLLNGAVPQENLICPAK